MFLKNQTYFPIINTARVDETVDFYVSLFEFDIAYREGDFVVLSQGDKVKNYLGILKNDADVSTESPIKLEYNTTTGTMLNFYVTNIGLAFQQFLWHRAPIINDIATANCGSKFFAVRDPNGVLVTLTEKSSNHNKDNRLNHLEKYIA